QNQQEPQPRERDYFYVGAFFVYSLWIALGMRGIIELLQEKFKEHTALKPIIAGVLFLGIVGVPVNMAHANWFEHDRSRNYVPWDYAYNLLQSVEPNAVLFTNGDNDTFPLWYLQDVEGVRRDIRIVCLSLANTDWYDLQLKNNTPHGAEKVPISMTNEQLQNIQPVEWKTQTFRLPVPKEIYQEFGITDTSITNTGYIQYTMKPTMQSGDIQAVRAQDLLMQNIVQTNAWKRPVYFAVTVAPGNFIGLTPYLQMQGLALQLTPARNSSPMEDYALNEPIMRQCFLHAPKAPHTEPHYGFLFTNLNNPNIYYDDNVRMLMLNYRYGFMRLAEYYAMHADTTRAIAALDSMEAKLPVEVIPMDYKIMSDVVRLYYGLGAMPQFHRYAALVEKGALNAIKENPNDVQSYYNPYRILMDLYSEENEYQKSIDLLESLQALYPNERSITTQIERLKEQMKMRANPDTAAKPITK
ncbi:MAG: hypothetical protein B7Z63_01730, partial [Ignavibacteriae bacterium 37-53-5]